jgi:hypothetical protein
MTNKLRLLRRNPSGIGHLYTIIEIVAFANWSLMPMGAHKGGVGNHH